MSHANATKMIELMEVKSVETLWGTSLAAFTTYWIGQPGYEIARNLRLFRKPWMKAAFYATVFAGSYRVFSQLPSRYFPKFLDQTNQCTFERTTSVPDLVSRFRVFEDSDETGATFTKGLHSDLSRSLPLTEKELLEYKINNEADMEAFAKKWRVKRLGKDENDLYWALSKVHGLENIAFADPEKLKKAGGNPLLI